MPMSVTLAKSGNRGKSYTTYLKPLVKAEWIRQLTAAHPPQLPNATPTGRTQAHFMRHGYSLYNNLYKISQRVTYDKKKCSYCDQQAIGNEIHILLQCPGTKHIANDLVATLTTLLTRSHQPTWNSLTLYQQTPIMLADPPTTLPKKFHQTWLHATLPHILTYIVALQTHLYNITHALLPS